jgi:hypothetical protein
MSDFKEDPIVISSRREAICFAVLWGSTLAYTVGYCFTHGYVSDSHGFDRTLDGSLEGMTFVLGWPDWVFWGIIFPWSVCTLISIVFATVVMRDAPLGEEAGAVLAEGGDSDA